MEEEIKTCFEVLDKRFEEVRNNIDTRIGEVRNSVDSRVSDARFFFTIVISAFSGFFAIVIGTATIAMNMNLNTERTNINTEITNIKNDLKDFKDRIIADLDKFKNELRQIEPAPELVLLGTNREHLEGQDVVSWFESDKDNQTSLVFNSFMQNKSDSLSGSLYMKIYTSDPLPLSGIRGISTDEPEFKYEIYFTPNDLNPNQIPGQFWTQWNHFIRLENDEIPPSGKYPALIKVYYGKGKVVRARFMLVVPEK